MSVLADGQGSLARVAAWRSPRRANILLHKAAIALKGANVLLQEAAFALRGANVTLERG
jgi:hypothetical protein